MFQVGKNGITSTGRPGTRSAFSAVNLFGVMHGIFVDGRKDTWRMDRQQMNGQTYRQTDGRMDG